MLEMAGCAVPDHEGRLLLVHRNTRRFQHWEFPGGKPDPDENVYETAIRETEEETDLPVAIIRKLVVCEFVQDEQTARYSLFLARTLDIRMVPVPMESDTHDAVDYFSPEEMRYIPHSLSVEHILATMERENVTIPILTAHGLQRAS
ncbi:MAG: hydrolase [Candidatus Saccharibacteria bacterium]|nr:hydrolase [Candidatus Saccharibacteria bacterium]